MDAIAGKSSESLGGHAHGAEMLNLLDANAGTIRDHLNFCESGPMCNRSWRRVDFQFAITSISKEDKRCPNSSEPRAPCQSINPREAVMKVTRPCACVRVLGYGRVDQFRFRYRVSSTGAFNGAKLRIHKFEEHERTLGLESCVAPFGETDSRVNWRRDMLDIMKYAFERRRCQSVSGIESRNVGRRSTGKGIESGALFRNLHSLAGVWIERIGGMRGRILVTTEEKPTPRQFYRLDNEGFHPRRRDRTIRRHRLDE